MNNRLLFITDDDAEDRDLLRDALLQERYDGAIEVASDGEEFMQKLAGLKQAHTLPHLLVLDLNMPLKDGYQVLQELKADNMLSEIPVIVFTSSLDEREATRCIEYGCLKLLRKPYNLAGFRAVACDIIQLVNTLGKYA